MVRILLLKSDGKHLDDEYKLNLLDNGYDVEFIECIKIVPINTDAYSNYLMECDDYHGFLMISPQCIKIFAEVVGNLSNMYQQKIKSKVFFTVGRKSNDFLKQLEYNNVYGEANKDCLTMANGLCVYVKSLMENTHENLSFPLKFLLPASDTSKSLATIQKIVEENNLQLFVELKYISTYQTLKDTQNVESSLERILHKPINGCVFFSPSCVDSTYESLMKNALSPTNCCWIAIGQTTANHLNQIFPSFNFPFPTYPNVEQLIKLINRIFHQ